MSRTRSSGLMSIRALHLASLSLQPGDKWRALEGLRVCLKVSGWAFASSEDVRPPDFLKMTRSAALVSF